MNTNPQKVNIPAVHCRGVSKTYHTDGTDTPALRGIDLVVEQGELMMLVGPSGCGKTTLISIIAGILDYDSGSCNLFGEELKSLSEKQRTAYRGKTLGFVFQSLNLIPTITAAENVAIPLLLQQQDYNYSIKRATEMLDRVGLGNRANSFPRNLSGGQQQRVAIARALVHDPRLIVCDEPTSALDQKTGHQVLAMFREVALSESRSLIIVTHDNRIFSFADRIAYMNDGLIENVEIVGSGSKLS